MPKMEKFNSFSKLPEHQLICLQRSGLKGPLHAAGLAYFPTVKESRILIVGWADSYLVLDSLSWQSRRLLSPQGEIDAEV